MNQVILCELCHEREVVGLSLCEKCLQDYAESEEMYETFEQAFDESSNNKGDNKS